MANTLTVELTDQQVIALIKLAASASMSVEEQLLLLLDLATIDADLLPVYSLDEFLKDLPEPSPRARAIHRGYPLLPLATITNG